ncbi:replication-relaxation family protein [Kitasatospora sp. NPDC050463]|uniref:replication-relaxation family protein n=1 Tax=Kitasatospora sp. NPDC050463 TaxID=3155786 RepID=UPI0033E440F9
MLPSEQSLLDRLATMRVATVAQLIHLETGDQVSDTAIRTMRKRLARLESYGLVRRFANTARDRVPSPPGYVFVLTNVGARLTDQIETVGLRQRKVWHPSHAFIDHWLAIGDLYVQLSVEARGGEVAIRDFQIEGAAKRDYRDRY